MARAPVTSETTATKVSEAAASPADGSEKVERREIKGGIPYTVGTGTFKKALEGIITAERPDKFTRNYMETILNLRGGAAQSVPPLLKKMQFLASDGSPTPLYSKFKTEGGRSQAAFEGLRNAFGELFKRNEYVYRADESVIKDSLVEITGLKRNDPIIRLMYTTFDVIKSFVNTDPTRNQDINIEDSGSTTEQTPLKHEPQKIKLGLSYQINIVLPETENVAVFNAIFKSLRDNLLR